VIPAVPGEGLRGSSHRKGPLSDEGFLTVSWFSVEQPKLLLEAGQEAEEGVRRLFFEHAQGELNRVKTDRNGYGWCCIERKRATSSLNVSNSFSSVVACDSGQISLTQTSTDSSFFNDVSSSKSHGFNSVWRGRFFNMIHHLQTDCWPCYFGIEEVLPKAEPLHPGPQGPAAAIGPPTNWPVEALSVWTRQTRDRDDAARSLEAREIS
jgi:hypothetical protein